MRPEEINRIVTKFLEPERCLHQLDMNKKGTIFPCKLCKESFGLFMIANNANPDFFNSDAGNWFLWAVGMLLKKHYHIEITITNLIIDIPLGHHEEDDSCEWDNLTRAHNNQIPATLAAMLAQWITEKENDG